MTSWQPVDCHAHSTFSDGSLTVPQVVERAADRGVRPSVADHVSRDVSRAMTSVEQVRAYLDVLEQHPVLRAAEFCWHDTLWRDLPGDVVERFTHRIGSLHAVRLPGGALVHAFAKQLPGGLSPGDYMSAHLASLADLVREMPVDILAHPTLVTIPFRHLPAEELWSEDHESRMVDLLYESGIVFELSSRYPAHERIVERAVARGVRVSLGSDGHTRDQVADVERPLALARRLGVPDEALYDPLRHGSKSRPRPRGKA